MFRRRRSHVVRRGGHIVSEDYGKDYTADKYVEWGSITKLVTAQAVVALADGGELDLDAPVRDRLGLLPTSVTARGLLTHTSGVPRVHAGMPAGVLSDPYAGIAADVLREHLGRIGETDLIGPGQMTYSNLGYAVLGLLLEQATDGSWFDAVRDLVLLPWGLSRVIPLPEVADRAHILGFDRKPHRPWSLAEGPYAAAGALWSPLTDLADYGQKVLDEGGYVRPERGWQHVGDRWWHNGATRDSGSCLVLVPSLDLVVATHALAAFPGAADRLADKLTSEQEEAAA